MKKFLIVLCLIFSCTSKEKTNITLKFKKNVEFFGYLIELVEPSDNAKNHPIKVILDNYKENQNNPTLQKIFAEGSNYSYTFYVKLFYELPDFSKLTESDINTIIEDKFSKLPTEEINKRKRLISLCLQFYKESNFESIWSDLKKIRENTKLLLSKRLPSYELIATIENFYQKKYSNYEVVPSLTIWSSAGWGFNNLEKSKATFILGPLDKNYDFSNIEKFKDLTIHEFGHSFVNSVVLENKTLLEETKELFKLLKSEMTKQGYHYWEDCIIEHFVRAGEIIIPQILDENTNKKSLLEFYVNNKKFTYLPFIVERLKNYRLANKLSYKEAVKFTLKELKENYINKINNVQYEN